MTASPDDMTPDSPADLLARAQALLAQGSLSQAAKLLTRLVEQEPTHGTGLLELARIRIAEGLHREAIAWLSRLTAHHPDWKSTRLNSSHT